MYLKFVFNIFVIFFIISEFLGSREYISLLSERGKYRQFMLSFYTQQTKRSRSTVNSRRSTVQSRRSTVHSRRSTVHSRRSTLKSRRSTLNSRRSTLNSRRSTVHSRRPTLNRRPYGSMSTVICRSSCRGQLSGSTTDHTAEIDCKQQILHVEFNL